MDRSSPRGATNLAMVIIPIVVLIAATGAFFLRGGGGNGDGEIAPDTFIVTTGGFDITIPASGELAALKQTEIASRLEVRAVITYIVEEGELVKQGDVLIRLEDEDLSNRIRDEQDSVNTAETSLITAQSNLEIRRQSNASELAKAELDITLAELALKAWEEGEVISSRQKRQLELETAQKDSDRLVARYEASEKLLEKEFISKDEFQRDEISMIQARSRLEQAKLAIEVYENYQYKQDRAKKESDLQQARDERERVVLRHANDIKSKESEVESKVYQLDSRKERLAKAQRQLELCTIKAPQDGLVVYASSLESGRMGRGGDEAPQVGSELHRNRTVIILPDTSQMVAEVKVNEALSGKIRPGQRAVVVSDAVPDTPVTAEVLNIGVMAETGGWRDPNRRDYSVRIRLADGNELGFKPSMRCKADIYVGRVDDALFIPIQAVFRKGPVAFVYVPDGSGYSEREVSIGRSSELYIEILKGLAEGDAVLLREPSPDQIRTKLEIEGTGPNGMRQNGRHRPGAGPDSPATRGEPGNSSAGPKSGPPSGGNAADRKQGEGRPTGERPAGGGRPGGGRGRHPGGASS